MLRPTLATVAERVRPWPAAVLVLVPVGAPTLSALSPGTAVAARVPDAADLVAARPRPRGARELLEPILEAPALARGFLRSTLRAWDAERYGDDALLVVDELVANAVLHAGTEIELRLALSSDRLGVAVADRSPGGRAWSIPSGGRARPPTSRRGRLGGQAPQLHRREHGELPDQVGPAAARAALICAVIKE